MTDDAFMAAFEDGTLPLDAFHHADHLRMAYLYLQRYAPLEAIERFSSALFRFAAAHGKANLYNETITWALLLIIRERMARATRKMDWAEFLSQNDDLLNWKQGLLKTYYREETLASDLARSTFVFPDRFEASLR